MENTSKEQVKYVALLKARDNNQEKDYTFINEQNELQVKSDLLETRKQLAAEKQQLQGLMCQEMLSAQSIFDKEDEIEYLEAGIKRLQGLLKIF